MCNFVFTFLHISIIYFQSEKVLYLATEYVEPLETHLRKLPKEGHQREFYIAFDIIFGNLETVKRLIFSRRDIIFFH